MRIAQNYSELVFSSFKFQGYESPTPHPHWLIFLPQSCVYLEFLGMLGVEGHQGVALSSCGSRLVVKIKWGSSIRGWGGGGCIRVHIRILPDSLNLMVDI